MKVNVSGELINELCKHVGESVDLYHGVSDETIRNKIIDAVIERSHNLPMTANEKIEVIKIVFNKMRGMDILQPLLDDKDVTEIMINGPGNVFIEKQGRIHPVEIRFENIEQLNDIIQKIVSTVNRTVNEANPICDARLNDGSRVSVVMRPLALDGPILTIRKFAAEPFDMKKLQECKSITKEAVISLKCLVKAKYNIVVCGGTGSGKTTLLNALSDFIPKDERIITIEDSAELQIKGIKNLVRFETRNANPDGEGKITIRDLIRASLRMRPDRIIVGEVRGDEAIDMLQAMNTGHDGSLSTAHANSAKDLLSRLETMVLTAANIPLEAIKKQIASAVDIIIFISRMGDKTRKVLEISEVTGYINGEIQLNPLFTYEIEKTGQEGKLKNLGNKIINNEKFRIYDVAENL